MWDRTIGSVFRPRLTAFLRQRFFSQHKCFQFRQESGWERVKDLTETAEPRLGVDILGSDFGFFVIR